MTFEMPLIFCIVLVELFWVLSSANLILEVRVLTSHRLLSEEGIFQRTGLWDMRL